MRRLIGRVWTGFTGRSVLVVVSLTVALLFVVELPLALAVQERRRRDLVGTLERDALLIGSRVEDVLEGTERRDLQQLVHEYARVRKTRAIVVGADGRLVADSDIRAGVRVAPRDFTDRPEIDGAFEGRTVVVRRESRSLGGDFVFVAVPVRSGDRILGVVRVSVSTAALDARIRHDRLVFAAVAAVALGFAVGFGVALGRWAVAPLRKLSEAALRVGAGDLEARAPADVGPREVRDTARVFNATVSRLQQSLSSSQTFASDVAHQVRTPLAAMRLRLDALAASETLDSEKVERVLDDIDRLQNTVDSLLALTRIERADAHADVVDVDTVLSEVAAEREAMAAETGVRLRVHTAAGTTFVWFDPAHLHEAVANLVDNAIAHSPRGTEVVLSARHVDGSVEIHVTDEGPGIDPAIRERVLAGGLTTRPEGTGIGLALVARLVALNGASLELRDGAGGGLDAVIVARVAGGRSSPAVERARPDAWNFQHESRRS